MGGGPPTQCYVNSPPPSKSTEHIVSCENSDIQQYDGNISIFSESENNASNNKGTAALNLPIVATYNVRSLFPKVRSFRTDMLERNIGPSGAVQTVSDSHRPLLVRAECVRCPWLLA
jgi:hypothetical protein